jgi:hypothetical protein
MGGTDNLAKSRFDPVPRGIARPTFGLPRETSEDYGQTKQRFANV